MRKCVLIVTAVVIGYIAGLLVSELKLGELIYGEESLLYPPSYRPGELLNYPNDAISDLDCCFATTTPYSK